MDLLLIRHAEPVRIEGGDGPADPPLHPRGIDQAARLAVWLAGEAIHAVCASPMRRAQETAAPLAARQRLPVDTHDALAEWDRAATEYIPLEQLKAEGDPRWDAIIGGEAFGEHVDPATFRRTVVECVEGIVEGHPAESVAVVCHGGVVNMYLSWVLGLPEAHFFLPAYTSISRVAAARSGQRSVVSLNETGHLRDPADPHHGSG